MKQGRTYSFGHQPKVSRARMRPFFWPPIVRVRHIALGQSKASMSPTAPSVFFFLRGLPMPPPRHNTLNTHLSNLLFLFFFSGDWRGV